MMAKTPLNKDRDASIPSKRKSPPRVSKLKKSPNTRSKPAYLKTDKINIYSQSRPQHLLSKPTNRDYDTKHTPNGQPKIEST